MSAHMDIIFFNNYDIIYTYVDELRGGCDMHILKKINQLRLDRKWSLYRLSTESGVSQSTLTNMFNRETLPSITTLECICSAFGITLSEFFKENESITSTQEEELLALFRSASEDAKKSIITLLRELTNPK